MKFRELRADEIDCRVGMCNEKGFSLLLYKDARCDMNILDETVGADKWQRRHYECKGNLFCSVGIDCGDGYIFKDDCGIESREEKVKGESSDSFKRACFNWGIGRELYTAPFIYVKGMTEKNAKGNFVPALKRMWVSEIGYEDGKITKLTIRAVDHNNLDKVIYSFGDNAVKVSQDTAQSAELTLAVAKAMTTKGGTPFDKLSDDYLWKILDSSARQESKEAARLILAERERNKSDDLTPLEEDLPF